MIQITIGDIVLGDREIFPPYLYEAYQSTRRRAPMLPLIGSQALNACSL
jgi:protocatechuate 3,4-dioxygenase, beta subunit